MANFAYTPGEQVSSDAEVLTRHFRELETMAPAATVFHKLRHGVIAAQAVLVTPLTGSLWGLLK